MVTAVTAVLLLVVYKIMRARPGRFGRLVPSTYLLRHSRLLPLAFRYGDKVVPRQDLDLIGATARQSRIFARASLHFTPPHPTASRIHVANFSPRDGKNLVSRGIGAGAGGLQVHAGGGFLRENDASKKAT